VRLEGFRCDNCGTESIETTAPRSWIEVRSLTVTQTGLNLGGTTTFGVSGGLHYCRRACLLAAIEAKWEKERP